MAKLSDIQRIKLDLGNGFLLSIIQGFGTYSTEDSSVEVALIQGNKVHEPIGHVTARGLATLIGQFTQIDDSEAPMIVTREAYENIPDYLKPLVRPDDEGE